MIVNICIRKIEFFRIDYVVTHFINLVQTLFFVSNQASITKRRQFYKNRDQDITIQNIYKVMPRIKQRASYPKMLIKQKLKHPVAQKQ